MKRFLLITLLLVIGSGVIAQNLFFPSQSGTVLTYQTLDKKGKMTGQTRYTIKDISGSGDQVTVVYEVESMDNKGNRIYMDEIKVRQEGDKMYLDMSNLLNKAAFQQNGEIPPSIEISGNNMELPLVPVPGTSLPDANVSMAMKLGFLNLKMNVDVTNRKVEALEEVTVTAGTFTAFKISGDSNGAIVGIKVNSRGIDWYAYGIGLVKTESYDKKGELSTVLELVAIEKP